jgi:hypothetical protein
MPVVSQRFISLGSLSFVVAFLLVSWCAPVQGAIKPVGEVILANGTFLAIQSDRSSRSLTRGSEFYQGDRLWTGPRTKAQIRFSDGAIMTLRADTEFRVDEYEFDSQNASRNKSLFTLIKGGFRTITGLISRLKPENYRVKTSYAIVGVRGTTYETVIDNALYVAAWQGTVSVENDAGETILGFGQDTNYARVSGANRRPVTLLEAPPQLLESVDPDLQEFVRDFNRLLEILPSEGTLVRQGFAVFGGPGSTVATVTAPLNGRGTLETNGMVTIVDPSPARILSQGAATLVASANPLPGVSWGAWAGGPVEVQTIAGTTPVARPVFWLTMAPPTSVPTGAVPAYTNVISSSVSGSLGGPAVSQITSFNATVDFAGSMAITTTLQNGSNNWSATFNGPFSGTTYNVPVVFGLFNTTPGVTGNAVGGFSGSNASTIGGVFDIEQTGVPANHVEGVFVATQ